MFISNTAHHQAHQRAEGDDGMDGDPAKAPGWVMKIEGRLLDVRPLLILLCVVL